MTKDEFIVKQQKLLDQVPEAFRSWLSAYAYEHGHANGFDEVIVYLSELVNGLVQVLDKKNQTDPPVKGFRSIAEAFTIMAKYGDDGYVLSSEHDIVYAQLSVSPEEVSPEDMTKLEKLGWSIDGEFAECFSMSV